MVVFILFKTIQEPSLFFAGYLPFSCEVLLSSFCNDAVIGLANERKGFCIEPCHTVALTYVFPMEYSTKQVMQRLTPIITRLLSVLYEIA